MAKDVIRFEVKIQSLAQMKSRIVWPESTGPWIEGGIEDMIVHFTYAGWTAYMLECAISLMLTSHNSDFGQAVSEMLTKTIEAMGAVQMAEVRLTKDALDELRGDHIQP